MFQTIADFERNWNYERDATAKVFKALTDASLAQAVSPQDRTIGRIAWHMAQTHPEMLAHTGLTIDGPAVEAPVPDAAAEIVAGYERGSASVLEQVKANWTDETLQQTDNMYGEVWKRGFTLMALVCHEVHHRGQLTVLMRQAGLNVPGIYGPAREEWSAMGMAAPAI